MRSIVLSVAMLAMTASMSAQSMSAKVNLTDLQSTAAGETLAKSLLAKAKTDPAGSAVQVLHTYPDQSYLEMVVRVKDGGGERHATLSDFYVVVDGEAVVLTGGKMIDGKETTPGETRGTKVAGGTPHTLHKGDIFHVAPGVPHQTTVPAGKTFTYYVIKVATVK